MLYSVSMLETPFIFIVETVEIVWGEQKGEEDECPLVGDGS